MKVLTTTLGIMMLAAPALAEERTYVIDPGHTHIVFEVERFGYAATVGVFPDSSGEIVLDMDNPENSRVTATVHTPTVWTGLASRDQAVNGPGFLNTAEHPEIRFSSTAIELIDEDSARVTGDFTLLGVTRPVTFDVDLNRIGPDPSMGGREGAGFSMRTSLDRSDFGNTTASALIGDTVTIRIEALGHAAE
ncbi:MAG: YceI family protein [Pseudomonadota bacterium]|nr:YceI family protein [Pseudomonadota bacterium]